MGSLITESAASAIINLPRTDAPPSSSLATPSSSSLASSPRGLVEDMELRALEGKLQLLTIQRQLSAVRCQRFVEELEAYTSSCSSAAPSPASSSMERRPSGAIPTSYSSTSHGSFPDDLDMSDGSVMSAWRRAPRRMPHRNSFGSRSVTGSGSISAAYSGSRSRGQCGGSRRSSFDRSFSSPAASSGRSSSSRLSFDQATVVAPAPAESSPLDAEGNGLPSGRGSFRRRTLDGSSTSRATVRFPRRSPFVANDEDTDSESDCNFYGS